MSITAGDLLKIKGYEVLTVTSDSVVYEALQLLADKNVGALLVFKSGELAGIFSERDYARKLVLKASFQKIPRFGK